MSIHPMVLGFFAATLFTFADLHAQSPDLKAKLDAIRELLAPSDADPDQIKELKISLKRYPDQWQRMLDRQQLAGFSEYVSQAAGFNGSAIPGLTEKIQDLTKSVTDEVERRDAARITEVESILSQAGKTLVEAKKAEDLDSLVQALSKLKVTDYGSNPKLQAQAREIQGAQQIAGNWQDYLIAQETGNFQAGRRNLEQISSQLAATPIVPRSIVLRLLNPEKLLTPAAPAPETTTVPQEVIDGIQDKLAETGDTQAALAELKAIPEKQQRNSDLGSLTRTLQAIEELHMLEPSMSESETFANLRSLQMNQSQNRFTFSRAIDRIGLNAIARSYGIEIPSPKITSSRKVLESIATDARKRMDWPMLRKAITSLDSLGTNPYLTDSNRRLNDLKALPLLEVGEAAEKRGDLEAATFAYLEASSIDGQYVQRDVACGRIAELKQKSPEKVGKLLEQSDERRVRAEAARQSAEMEFQEKRMMLRGGMQPNGLRAEDLKAMRPMIEEIVAGFMKQKRLEDLKAPEKVEESKPDTN